MSSYIVNQGTTAHISKSVYERLAYVRLPRTSTRSSCCSRVGGPLASYLGRSASHLGTSQSVSASLNYHNNLRHGWLQYWALNIDQCRHDDERCENQKTWWEKKIRCDQTNPIPIAWFFFNHHDAVNWLWRDSPTSVLHSPAHIVPVETLQCPRLAPTWLGMTHFRHITISFMSRMTPWMYYLVSDRWLNSAGYFHWNASSVTRALGVEVHHGPLMTHFIYFTEFLFF